METSQNILTGSEGAEWDLKIAAEWTKNYRDKFPGETISHFFGRELLQKILAQDGCMGLRFYHAIDDSGNKHLIIVGATSDGNDQLPAQSPTDAISTAALVANSNTVGQQGAPCPGTPGCPDNVLTGA
jgi:hypothetical protein